MQVMIFTVLHQRSHLTLNPQPEVKLFVNDPLTLLQYRAVAQLVIKESHVVGAHKGNLCSIGNHRFTLCMAVIAVNIPIQPGLSPLVGNDLPLLSEQP